MSSPWKDPRTGIYYIRRGVPAELKEQLGTVYKKSLRTRDIQEAKARFPLELAKCERAFALARERLTSPPLATITKAEAERLADAWLAWRLEEDEDFRSEGLSDRDYDQYQDTLDIVIPSEEHDLPRGKTDLIQFDMEDFLKSHFGITLKDHSEAYRTIAYAFMKADVKASNLIQRRHNGEAIDTPNAPTLNPQGSDESTEGTPLTIAYAAWKRERKPAPKLEAACDTMFRRFTQLHGDLSVSQVTRRQVAEFKDNLLKYPLRPSIAIRDLPFPETIKVLERNNQIKRLSPATAKRDLGLLRSFFEWCIANAYREDNPCDRVKVIVPKNQEEDRLPYDADDLKAIFNSPVYTEGKRPKGGAGEAAYWLPLLALYTGARLEELGQLLVSDVKQEGQIAYLDINTLDEGKSLKTASSRRRVPIHQELLNRGFLEYVKRQKNRLFSELKPDVKGKQTGNWSKWYSRYLRETVGVKDRRKVFHSFRHTFKDACRSAGIPEEVHDALTGHSSGGTGRRYGTGVPIERLNEALQMIKYGGLRI